MEALYLDAVEDIDRALYPEAIEKFNNLKSRYPYSKFAALADLRIGDTHMERGKPIEAIDAFRQFVKMHPNHDQIPYALYRVGEAFSDQMPEDWWFMPPPEEKDQANTRLAITSYQEVIQRFPGHEFAKKAEEKLQQARQQLALHELYVAEFYLKRDSYRAAAGRAEALVRDFPGLGHDAQALWILAKARHKLGENESARSAASQIVDRFPNSDQAAEARELLPTLGPAANTSQKATTKTGG